MANMVSDRGHTLPFSRVNRSLVWIASTGHFPTASYLQLERGLGHVRVVAFLNGNYKPKAIRSLIILFAASMHTDNKSWASSISYRASGC